MREEIPQISDSQIEDWALPSNVRATQSTREKGASRPPYQGLNLGLHVNDDATLVHQNRLTLQQSMVGCQHLHWLEQIHSTQVLHLTSAPRIVMSADASVTQVPGQACIVMTADCLPVLFCAADGSEVAAAHAGWRGLLNGVIENTIDAMQTSVKDIRVWLGPCIGPRAFEVGEEVRAAFIKSSPHHQQAFVAQGNNKWLAHLHLLAVQRLQKYGVTDISADARCTFEQPELFFSYRRDGVTGRMASAIWIEQHA
ncbi:peptidoglycan editing factor PgeF [Echinimonas agarilytica]|uniref:Purine nucleoside phosphorylase n=1 Tax=Echinimonas agarilytica TaxID=1215918 RepID=A0AA42B856_9GAMM|nr:peptidoglycan editing factor PgeF [Echinimonas agarilytica]MCM2680617.1 peptidoglycan editing factor PgeF [Echinimonas agarilytica]